MTATEKPKLKKLLDTAIANITITNGPFYFGNDGKLCGVQSVKISNWSELVAEINNCKAFFSQEFSNDEDTTDADREAIASFNANPDDQMLRTDGNSFTLRVPMSRASFDKMFVTEPDHKQETDRLRAAGIRISWCRWCRELWHRGSRRRDHTNHPRCQRQRLPPERRRRRAGGEAGHQKEFRSGRSRQAISPQRAGRGLRFLRGR